MSENVQHHIAIYKKVAAALAVLTVLTVAVSYIDFGVALGITVALIIAATKGSLVLSFFMHLMEEKKTVPLSRNGIGLIIGSLIVTALFFLVIIFIPLMGHADRVGDYYTLPNANAPTVETPPAH